MDNANTPVQAPVNSTTENESGQQFKGYTLDELKYQRGLVLLKKTFLKEKLIADADEMRQRIPFASKDKNGMPKVKGVIGKIITGMDYMDYVLLGVSLFSTGKKIFSFFRRK